MLQIFQQKKSMYSQDTKVGILSNYQQSSNQMGYNNSNDNKSIFMTGNNINNYSNGNGYNDNDSCNLPPSAQQQMNNNNTNLNLLNTTNNGMMNNLNSNNSGIPNNIAFPQLLLIQT